MSSVKKSNVSKKTNVFSKSGIKDPIELDNLEHVKEVYKTREQRLRDIKKSFAILTALNSQKEKYILKKMKWQNNKKNKGLSWKDSKGYRLEMEKYRMKSNEEIDNIYKNQV